MNREPHSFRKKWGQNFLVDPNIIKKIYSVIKPKKNDNVIEIGPGDGALTKVIYPNVRDMATVEVDPLLIEVSETPLNLVDSLNSQQLLVFCQRIVLLLFAVDELA